MSARTDLPWFVQIAAASSGDSSDFGTTLYALASNGSVYLRHSWDSKWKYIGLPDGIFYRSDDDDDLPDAEAGEAEAEEAEEV